METEVCITYGLSLDQETRELLAFLENHVSWVTGYQSNEAFRIGIKDIYYIEYVDGKTFLYLESEVYLSHDQLYEWEKRLARSSFVRISKTVVVNLNYLKSVRPLLDRRMEATLKNGERLMINRHYLPAFKQRFGL